MSKFLKKQTMAHFQIISIKLKINNCSWNATLNFSNSVPKCISSIYEPIKFECLNI